MVNASNSKAIFLDRDGVLNEAVVVDRKPYPPSSISEVKISAGVVRALAIFKKKNYICIVVSNQPDVARGKTTREAVEEINETLKKQLDLEFFYVCYHDDSAHCECRKPRPGLLKMAAVELNIDLDNSYMVGDRWRDVEAGQAVNCKCVFLDHNYDEKRPNLPYESFSSLLDFALSLE